MGGRGFNEPHRKGHLNALNNHTAQLREQGEQEKAAVYRAISLASLRRPAQKSTVHSLCRPSAEDLGWGPGGGECEEGWGRWASEHQCHPESAQTGSWAASHQQGCPVVKIPKELTQAGKEVLSGAPLPSCHSTHPEPPDGPRLGKHECQALWKLPERTLAAAQC